ncbi:MAG: hypothetical protein ACFCUU_09885, partial [Cyclobacteriaceae bacterium]
NPFGKTRCPFPIALWTNNLICYAGPGKIIIQKKQFLLAKKSNKVVISSNLGKTAFYFIINSWNFRSIFLKEVI